jgi:hypothetical protein
MVDIDYKLSLGWISQMNDSEYAWILQDVNFSDMNNIQVFQYNHKNALRLFDALGALGSRSILSPQVFTRLEGILPAFADSHTQICIKYMADAGLREADVDDPSLWKKPVGIQDPSAMSEWSLAIYTTDRLVKSRASLRDMMSRNFISQATRQELDVFMRVTDVIYTVVEDFKSNLVAYASLRKKNALAKLPVISDVK